eukprot:1509991-Karenia_brevis.AAC.1
MADVNPLTHVVLIGGDFNARAPGDGVLHLDGMIRPGKNGKQPLASQAQWQSVLDLFLELDNAATTHYDHKSNAEARLDRLFVSLPSWFMRLQATKAVVGSPPYEMWKKGLSDHTF